MTSNAVDSDALVFFGATGDLAYKKIFPSLQSMVRHGSLTVPVIGVAGSGWTIAQLRNRVKSSLQTHGGLDEAAFTGLLARLQYIDGDYRDASTFAALHASLAGATRPTFYL